MTDWSRGPQAPEPARDPQRGTSNEGRPVTDPRSLGNEPRVPAAEATAKTDQEQRRGGDPKVTAATTKTSTERTERPPARDGDVDGGHRAPKGGSNLGAVLSALVLGLVLGAFAMSLLSNDDGGDPFAGAIDPNRYQAVILSNDKVYFGRIEDLSDDFFQLDNAFFLRETRADAEAEPERALLPVNREIHAPDNTMLIRKDEVVLVENLAEDSPILTEIDRQLGEE